MGKPTIRFEGYTDDWEQRKLDDVVEFLDTMRKPLEGAKRISGPYPYYGASGIVDYVDGYLFDEELIMDQRIWKMRRMSTCMIMRLIC